MEFTMIQEYLDTLGRQAVNAKQTLQGLTGERKMHALEQVAAALIKEQEKLLAANDKDYQ